VGAGKAKVRHAPDRSIPAVCTGAGIGTGTTTTGTLKLNLTDYVIRVGYRF